MKIKNTHLVYGLIAGALTAIGMYVIDLNKMQQTPFVGWLVYIPFLICMIFNALAFSRANEGFVTFKSVFGAGFKATLIVAIFVVVYSLMSVKLFPEIKELSLAASKEAMLKMNIIPAEEVEKAVRRSRDNYTTGIISGAVFGTLFIGAVFSLIAAGIAPKKGERPFEDNF